jgi:hypothetical protein
MECQAIECNFSLSLNEIGERVISPCHLGRISSLLARMQLDLVIKHDREAPSQRAARR